MPPLRPVLPPGSPARFSVVPPLPQGIRLDPDTGVIHGAATGAAPRRRYRVTAARGSRAYIGHVLLEVVDLSKGRFVVVSPNGNDAQAGTLDAPVRTVDRGIAMLQPGDTLLLRDGTYYGPVNVRRLRGTPEAPITIRSYPGERAVLAGALEPFASNPDAAWEPMGNGEYRSTHEVGSERDLVNRAAFLDGPYTRLLTYSRREDLLATNQRWDWLQPGDPRSGPTILRSERQRRNPVTTDRRPWTYFGPGVWYDPATRRVHVRLAPTNHSVDGLAEYAGEQDPRRVPIALSPKSMHALRLGSCAYVRVAELSIRYGGDRSVVIDHCDHVELDRVEIHASTYGLVIANSDGARVTDSVIDGGIPPWSFRSDFKDDYAFDDAGTPAKNNLVRKTQRTLLMINGRSRDVEIAFSELRNGHDVYLGGESLDFHHNRITNVHDEAMIVARAPGPSVVRIHHNAIDRTLSALSFIPANPGSRVFVYRNIIDLRSPTAGYRPRIGNALSPWRFGHLFKNNKRAGDLFFYQNTVLLAEPTGNASFKHFLALDRGEGSPRRWILNNLFVDHAGAAHARRPLAFVPHPEYLARITERGEPVFRSDGNLWQRRGQPMAVFRCLTRVVGARCERPAFTTLRDLQRDPVYARHHWEAHSLEGGAGLAFVRLDGRPTSRDDLRLSSGSAARRAGIRLPPELSDPDRPKRGRPDIGALSFGAPRTCVGPLASRCF